MWGNVSSWLSRMEKAKQKKKLTQLERCTKLILQFAMDISVFVDQNPSYGSRGVFAAGNASVNPNIVLWTYLTMAKEQTGLIISIIH